MAYLIFASIDARTIERLHAFAEFFEQQQHRVDVITNGRILLEKALRELPDVVVTDALLLVHNEFELLKKLREGPERADQPALVLLTALCAEVGVLLKGDATTLALFDGFVVKPYPDESDDRVFREQFLSSVGLLLAKRAVAASTPDAPHP